MTLIRNLRCIQPTINFTFLLGILLVLNACQRYSVSINDKSVYEPAPLFSGYQIADRALKACVAAAIQEQEVRQAKQLKQLNCPPGEIKSLIGIKVFVSLQQLGLKGNAINTIASLINLSELEHLDLGDNQLLDASTLNHLQKLKSVNL